MCLKENLIFVRCSVTTEKNANYAWSCYGWSDWTGTFFSEFTETDGIWLLCQTALAW